MPADVQFQLKAQYPANLDRCRRCGYPRILHGDDGACGLSFSRGSRVLALLVTFGGLLAALGGAAWLLATAPAINAASVLAFAGLVVLILAAFAMALARRG
jgi:hypothetical protein